MQSLFPNPENILRPGQYAKIRVAAETRQGALVVPQQAVQQLQGSNQVAVVGTDNKIDLRPVKVGEQVGNMWVITQGLKLGERVVVEGVQKAKAGMTVNPKPSTAESAPAQAEAGSPSGT
jgi:membrane fusion protein (multidrug efflux system)